MKDILNVKETNVDDVEEMLRGIKQRRYDNLPDEIKEVVNYYKPKMSIAHLVDLPKLMAEEESWNYGMTIIMLNYFDKTLQPIILDYVFGCYDNLDDTLEYEQIYNALDRYGLVDEYNKVIGGELDD